MGAARLLIPRRASLACLVALAACAVAPSPPPEPEPEDPRLSVARAVARGGVPSTTPHLDALARQTAELTPELGLVELLHESGHADGSASGGLRAGDEVVLDILGHPEFSGLRRLAPDGAIETAPIGRVHAAGSTPVDLAARVASTLGETYLQDKPRVTVTVSTRATCSVQVVGRVGAHVAAPAGLEGTIAAERDRPWVTRVELAADRGLDLYELIIGVGGPGPDADVEQVALVRRAAARVDTERAPGDASEPTTRCFHFSWSSVVAAHLEGRDVWLQPDDQVIVPRLPLVHVYGAVPAPGAYPLEPGDTVATLVLRAGGLADPGATRLVVIDAEAEQRAQPETPLLSGQVVWVAEHGEVHVVGAGVNRSGPVQIPSQGLSVVQAIAQAGWFTPFASPNRVEILRNRVRIQVPVGRILDGEVPERSYVLQPGDTVVVPEGLW